MSEPPLCVVERWPPLASAPDQDRDGDQDGDRTGQLRRGAAGPRASFRARLGGAGKWPGPTHGAWPGRETGGPDDTHPLRPRTAVPGAAVPGWPQPPQARSPEGRAGQRRGPAAAPPGRGGRSAVCVQHLPPASGSGTGSSPPPAGASSSSSPPLPCRACTARDSHRRLRGGRARPFSPPSPAPAAPGGAHRPPLPHSRPFIPHLSDFSHPSRG